MTVNAPATVENVITRDHVTKTSLAIKQKTTSAYVKKRQPKGVYNKYYIARSLQQKKHVMAHLSAFGRFATATLMHLFKVKLLHKQCNK